MAQVICVGLAVLDHVFMLPKIPNIPTKWHATAYHPVGGGNAATAAVSISRAGGDAVYWGRMGDDENANLIVRELEEYGVNVENVRKLKGVSSGVSAVLVDSNGERLIVNYSDPQLISDAGWLPLETLSNADAVLVDVVLGGGAPAPSPDPPIYNQTSHVSQPRPSQLIHVPATPCKPASPPKAVQSLSA